LLSKRCMRMQNREEAVWSRIKKQTQNRAAGLLSE
jgi:hypothetical protein